GDRVAARHQEPPVAFLQRMTETAVTNAAAIDEKVLHPGGALLACGIGDVAAQRDRALLRFERVELIADFLAEEEPKPIEQPGRRRYLVNRFEMMTERELQGRLRQGEPGKGLGD